MAFLKPSGIAGLNTSHPLYPKINGFWEIGQLDKELLSDTSIAYAVTPTYQDDVNLGDSRLFQAGANSFPTNFVPTSTGSLVIVLNLNNSLGSQQSIGVAVDSGGGHSFRVGANTATAINNLEFVWRGGFGSTVRITPSTQAIEGGEFLRSIAMGVAWNSATGPKITYNGLAVTKSTDTTNNYTRTTQIPMCSDSQLNAYISAIVWFDELTDLELESITTDTNFWELVLTGGGTAYSIITDAASDAHAVGDVTLAYSPAATAYSITAEAVTDEHAAESINLNRGYIITPAIVTDTHLVNDVTLIYSAGATSYTITIDPVSDAHTVNDVMFYRGYNMAADVVADLHIVGNVSLLRGYRLAVEQVSDLHSVNDIQLYRGYNLIAEAVSDTHAANAIQLTYTTPTGTAYSITCESVADDHLAGALLFNRGYYFTALPVSDSHQALAVNLIYSGEEIALIDTYSVNYKQSDVSAAYSQLFTEVNYGSRE